MKGVKQAPLRIGRRIPVAGPAQLQHRQCCKFEQEGRIARRQTMYHAMLHEPRDPPGRRRRPHGRALFPQASSTNPRSGT